MSSSRRNHLRALQRRRLALAWSRTTTPRPRPVPGWFARFTSAALMHGPCRLPTGGR